MLFVSGRLGACDPELISTVMEYCLKMRCRSEPIFEAVAENFVCHAERHTTLQIAKQIVAMGRLNYLPQVRVVYYVVILYINQKAMKWNKSLTDLQACILFRQKIGSSLCKNSVP